MTTDDARIGQPIDLTVLQPDPKSRPHAEASPRTSLKVLRNLINECVQCGIDQLDIAQLTAAVEQQEAQL